MPSSKIEHYLEMDDFDAVLFDLDGVVTATAKVHSASWKRLFDGFLNEEAAASCGKSPRPFGEDDYLLYVDGKPRDEGVRSFLESRGISLPQGTPDDSPGGKTVCGLGNRKNLLFNEHLDKDGVEVFQSTVDMIGGLRTLGLNIAVVSSSKNCRKVIEAAGIAGLFDLRFDGVEAAELGLKGKPDPDTYLEAARRLGVEAARAVVVEDAISGVQAGHRGGFGMVIGIDRTGGSLALKDNGAHIVVDDLSRIRII